MKKQKNGISLIVLVITIIVMIILAAAVILSLTSNGIIDRANDAVTKTDLNQMQTLASTIWAEAYLDYRAGDITEAEIMQQVKDGLYNADKNYADKYNVKFAPNGVELSIPTWEVIYDKGEQIQDGMLVLGNENLFNGTDEYRLTIENNGNEIQIETKLLVIPGTETYMFAIIKGNTVIYPKSLEEAQRIMENDSSSVAVGGGCIQGEGQKICALMFEGNITNNYTIMKLEKKERYIDEGWEFAYVSSNGVWSSLIPKGKSVKGDIVAKFYKTDELVSAKLSTFDIAFEIPESNAYTLVVEGSGEMPNDFQKETTEFLKDVVQSMNSMMVNAESYPFLYTTSVVISDQITNIGDSFFSFYISLKELTLPNSITSIGEDAFWGCDNLCCLNIPDTVTDIGKRAFEDCGSLERLILPQNITSIEENMFWHSGIKEIEIPATVTVIGMSAFHNCLNLTNITISNSVTSIGYSAFEGCNSLTNVYYKGSEEQWNAITINDYNGELTSATIHFNSN